MKCKSWKKWILVMCVISLVGIVFFVCKGSAMRMKRYLRQAENFHKQKDYDQEMVNLEKALEISLEDNGELSLVTADIYRRMGECVRDTDQIAENFDKAIAIYEKCGRKDVAGLYYEKGKRLVERGTGSSISLGRESLERAISMYERDGYEDSDKLCGSYLILADVEMDEWKKWRYLEKAESCFEDFSKEGQWEMGNWVYRQMGVTWFREWDYEKAFEYFDTMLSRAEESKEEDAGQVIAEAQYMSGAALVLTDRAEEGKERIEKAVMFYDAYDNNGFYRNAAMAHAFLAVAYGMLEPENEQKALGQGELALSYFTQLEAVNSEDVRFIGYIQSILLPAYKGVYPEKGGKEFKVWIDGISKLNATRYISDYEADKDGEETDKWEYGKKMEHVKRDMSDRRFRDLIGEYNEIRYEDLITVRYSEDEIKMLQEYFESCIGTRYTMNWAYNDLKEKYAFECVRETDKGAYVMFQGEDGSLLCVYFNKDNLHIRDVGVYNKFFSVKDFEGIIPYVTKEKELHALSGELCSDMLISAVDIQYCAVEEGVILFYFSHFGSGWAEEGTVNPLLVRREFIPDGEGMLEGFETVPQLLPIDRHIAEVLEETKSENEE